MASNPILQSADRRGEKDDACEKDVLAKAASDSTLAGRLFWANALRDPSLEGANSEERLRARASRVSGAATILAPDAFERLEAPPTSANRYELVEPTVIPLPDFGESQTSPRDVERSPEPTGVPSYDEPPETQDESETSCEIQTPDETPHEQTEEPCLDDFSARTPIGDHVVALAKRPAFYTAIIELFLCPPCGLCALAFLWQAAKETARENYGAATRHDASAQTALNVGKALILVVFLFAAATMTAELFTGE